MNRVVARFVDGRSFKGLTTDFLPTKDVFHLRLATAAVGEPALEIRLNDLKAVFFVKDFVGDPEYMEKKELDPSRALEGRPIKVVFKDGETLVGTTTGYQPGRPGFFLLPADPGSNIERCYVVAGAAAEIGFI